MVLVSKRREEESVRHLSGRRRMINLTRSKREKEIIGQTTRRKRKIKKR